MMERYKQAGSATVLIEMTVEQEAFYENETRCTFCGEVLLTTYQVIDETFIEDVHCGRCHFRKNTRKARLQ